MSLDQILTDPEEAAQFVAKRMSMLYIAIHQSRRLWFSRPPTGDIRH